MLIPLSLIRRLLPLSLPATQIGEILTSLGIEVDAILNPQPTFAKVVVGEVLSVKRHPDAKNLQIAEVSDGEQSYSVVCGAPNCRANIKTAFAKIGAVLTDTDGKQRQIGKGVIRGVESSGMLCSGSELHLTKEVDGILELPQEMKTGDDAASLLWDPVFQLSLTPNLGHCMSALGIARELSAALQIPIQLESFQPFHLPECKVTVHDAPLCRRYMCCLIEGVEVGPSPFWLKHLLETAGQKSINHVVDATNYVMLMLGQPLHAFDAELIEGHEIHIKAAENPLIFLGLDGMQREVHRGDLLVCDTKKPIALAGVMGGQNSAISEKTKSVLLEAAYFDPISVRNTSKRLGLRTESSQRFEKGVDPANLRAALQQAAKIIGGQAIRFSDVKRESFNPREIAYRFKRINQILGTRLSETEVEEILARLEIQAKDGRAKVPTYRADLCSEIDLVEEVARIYGYNNIERSTPYCSISPIPSDPIFLFENEIRRRFVAEGLTEFITCDLVSPALGEISKEITPQSVEFLRTIYSKSEEFSVLRTSLLPGLLQVAKSNFAQKNLTLCAFEIGRIHFMQKNEIQEIPMGAILLTGNREIPHWSKKNTEVDFFDLKGVIENLLQAVFIPSAHSSFHPGKQADIQIEDLVVGSLGEVHPRLLEKFDIQQRIYYAEFNLSHLLKTRKPHLRVIPLPQFPSSTRDWTIPLPLKTPVGQILKSIEAIQSPLLETVKLIDVYEPEGTKEKHATFHFVYRSPLKTISFEEVETEHTKIIKSVVAK